MDRLNVEKKHPSQLRQRNNPVFGRHQLQDCRPETANGVKLQNMANDSPQVSQLRARQGMLINNIQLKPRININDDPVLETEAEKMGNKVSEYQDDPSVKTWVNRPVSDADPIIQRKIGMEFESLWKIYRKTAKVARQVNTEGGFTDEFQDTYEKESGIKHPTPIEIGDQKTPYSEEDEDFALAPKDPAIRFGGNELGWRIENDAGNLEFVIEPPLSTETAFLQMVKKVQDFALKMQATFNASFDARQIGWRVPPSLLERNQTLEINPKGKTLKAVPQATVGVQLKNLLRFFQQLPKENEAESSKEKFIHFNSIETGPVSINEMMKKTYNQVLNSDLHSFFSQLDNLKEDTKGLLAYIGYYLQEAKKPGSPAYPKSFFTLLNRSGFTPLFKALSDQEEFTKNAEGVIAKALPLIGKTSQEQLKKEQETLDLEISEARIKMEKLKEEETNTDDGELGSWDLFARTKGDVTVDIKRMEEEIRKKEVAVAQILVEIEKHRVDFSLAGTVFRSPFEDEEKDLHHGPMVNDWLKSIPESKEMRKSTAFPKGIEKDLLSPPAPYLTQEEIDKAGGHLKQYQHSMGALNKVEEGDGVRRAVIEIRQLGDFVEPKDWLKLAKHLSVLLIEIGELKK